MNKYGKSWVDIQKGSTLFAIRKVLTMLYVWLTHSNSIKFWNKQKRLTYLIFINKNMHTRYMYAYFHFRIEIWRKNITYIKYIYFLKKKLKLKLRYFIIFFRRLAVSWNRFLNESQRTQLYFLVFTPGRTVRK